MMKIVILIPLLFSLLESSHKEERENAAPYKISTQLTIDEQIKGKWVNEKSTLEYIVDSNLVHEREITEEKGTKYEFDGKTIWVTYKDGTTQQGSYSVINSEGKNQIILNLAGTTTSFNLIAGKPTSMIWQTDYDDLYYREGGKLKSAERVIYTMVLKK